jgi:hypothetical protein
VDEGDEAAVGAGTGFAINEFEAAAREIGENGFEVRDTIGDVVEAGAALGEDAGNGRIRRGRFEQFETAPGAADEHDVDALGWNRFERGTGGARNEFECWQRGAQRWNRDRDVVERVLQVRLRRLVLSALQV